MKRILHLICLYAKKNSFMHPDTMIMSYFLMFSLFFFFQWTKNTQKSNNTRNYLQWKHCLRHPHLFYVHTSKTFVYWLFILIFFVFFKFQKKKRYGPAVFLSCVSISFVSLQLSFFLRKANTNPDKKKQRLYVSIMANFYRFDWQWISFFVYISS